MSEETPAEIKETLQRKMNNSLDSLKKDFSAIHAGRANPSILDGVKVDYYGTPTPVNQVAAVSAPDAKTLVINPWEKNMIKEVERAVQRMNLGLSISNDGNLIRAIMPPLTEENRKDLAKQVRKMGEDCKIALRNVRREANEHLKKLEKDKLIGQDEEKQALGEIQKETDHFVNLVGDVVTQKENELMTI